LIILYARFYLAKADPMGQFYTYLLLFQGAMVGIVLSDNILLLLIFWELTSLSSFLLIGYWKHLPEGRQGARMALAAVGGAVLGTCGQFLLTRPLSALDISGPAWGWTAAMAFFCSVVPFLAITEGIRRVGASRSALISTVGPVATLVLAAILLGERLTATQLGGAALVFVAILSLEGRLPRWRLGRRHLPPIR
jgi:drug/metabolite transporter (DMT)-like permease